MNVVQIIDIAFWTLLGLGIFIGFLRGTFKASYNCLVFICLIILGWILSKNFINTMLDIELNVTVSGITVTTLRESIPTIVSNFDADLGALMVEGTETYSFTLAIFGMIARLAFMIVWFVLMATIFKLISFIIYLIIKPKNKKKKITSRLIGGIVGGLQASVLILMICIPISGIAAIASQVSMIKEEQTIAYAVPSEDGKLVFLSASTFEVETVLEEDFYDLYRSTNIGKFGGLIKFGGASVDEKLFDQVFSIQYNSQKIKLKSEIATVVATINTLNKETNNKITIENIMAIDSEKLYEIIDSISDLKMISVVLPVGAEYLLNSKEIKEKYSDLLDEIDPQKVITDLKKLDAKEEVKALGKGFVDMNKSGLLSALSEKDENGTSLSIFEVLNKVDADALNEACKKISNANLLDIIGDFGVNYIVKSNVLKKYIEAAGLSIEDINTDGILLSHEISSLGDVISAIKELNLTSTKIDITELEDEKINKLIDSLYGVDILSKNTKVLVAVVREELIPKDYKEIVPVMEMSTTDCKSTVKIAKTILVDKETGKFNTILDFDNIFSQESIDVMIAESKNSAFIRELINGAGNIVIEMICAANKIENGRVDFEGIVWVDELESFKSVLNVCAELGIDLSNATNTEIDIAKLTDKQISDFCSAIFSTNVFVKNQEIILEIIKQNAGCNLDNYIPTSLNNKNELIAFLKLVRTMKTLVSSEGEIDITNINIEEITEILSDLSKENVNNLIVRIIENSGALSNIENIDLSDIDLTTEEGKEEFKKILGAMEVIADISDITSIKDLKSENIEAITSSAVATKVVVAAIKENASRDGILGEFLTLDGIDDSEWADTPEGDGELKKLLDATSVLMSDNGTTDVSIDKLLSFSEEEIDTITSSKVITNSLSNSLNEIIEKKVAESFDKDKYGFELNVGTVEISDGQTAQEAWSEELKTLQTVVNMAENLDYINLSNSSSSQKLAETLEASKSSQILSEATLEIASKILETGYEDVAGYDAPVVTEETNLLEEFAKLQGLLSGSK